MGEPSNMPITHVNKKRDMKITSIFHRSLLTKRICLPINCIGNNLKKNIEKYISSTFEGKCILEGYIQTNSSNLRTYSSGVIYKGDDIIFEVVFETNVCFPVEGMIINCVATNINKAGIRAESATDIPTPIVVFIARDHNNTNDDFNNIKIKDKFNVRIIGQRYELNDKYISIIGELVKSKDAYLKEGNNKNKPRLTIGDV